MRGWQGGSIIEPCKRTVHAEKISSDREIVCKVRFQRLQWRNGNWRALLSCNWDCNVKPAWFWSSTLSSFGFCLHCTLRHITTVLIQGLQVSKNHSTVLFCLLHIITCYIQLMINYLQTWSTFICICIDL